MTEFPWLLATFLKSLLSHRSASTNFRACIWVYETLHKQSRDSPTTFFRGLDFVHAYVGNCLIASLDGEFCLQHLDHVFERQQRHGITSNIRKCQIETESLDFLGNIIDAQRIRPLKRKVVIIKDYPEPTTIQQLRTFNDLVSFYGRFLSYCASLMRPLTFQLRGNAKSMNLDNNDKNSLSTVK